MQKAYVKSGSILLSGLFLCLGCSSVTVELAGDPAQSALLIVEGKIRKSVAFGIHASSRLSGGSLINVEDYQTRLEGQGAEGYLVFSGIPPGTYRLRRIRARGNMWNNWESWDYYILIDETLPELTFSLKAGDIKYIGLLTLTDEQGFSGFGRQYQLVAKPGLEMAAVRKLERRFRDSPWGEALAQRLAPPDSGERPAVPAGTSQTNPSQEP